MFKVLKWTFMLALWLLSLVWRLAIGMIELFLDGLDSRGSTKHNDDSVPAWHGRTAGGDIEPVAYNDDGERVGARSGMPLY